MALIENLRALSLANGSSGDEGAVRGAILAELAKIPDCKAFVDGIGNILAEKRGANRPQNRVMFCARMDEAGFIKGYCWYNPETDSVSYATNGMPDLGANQMYQTATVKGPISTMPEIPGLAVWHQGHIGVYIGNGYAIEAMGTRYGVVKTRVAARSWTHWLKIPYINYIEETEEESP